MILIADSGSTKTNWSLSDSTGEFKRIHTQGINPYFQTNEEILHVIKCELLPAIESLDISAIYFYGAGCRNEEKSNKIATILQEVIGVQYVEVNSDLLAAARAVCGNQSGIACILGTGSNSCYYNGQEIVSHVPPLGFILGDEGSGAALGKQFIGDCLKNLLPSDIQDAFYQETGYTPTEIIEYVYRAPFPNRFLASLTPFIASQCENSFVRELVKSSFESFFIRNVMQYDYICHNVHLVGSVAFYFSAIIKEVADSCNIKLGKIVQDPLDGLLIYHAAICK